MNRLANATTTATTTTNSGSEVSAPAGLLESDLGMGNERLYGALPTTGDSGHGSDLHPLEGVVDNKTRQQRLRDAMNP